MCVQKKHVGSQNLEHLHYQKSYNKLLYILAYKITLKVKKQPLKIGVILYNRYKSLYIYIYIYKTNIILYLVLSDSCLVCQNIC